MYIYVHRGIFKSKSNINDGAFFISVKPYFKNILNLIKLPLGSIFIQLTLSWKKLTTVKTSGEKVFCQQWNNSFFGIWNYAMEVQHQQRFLNKHLLKVSKLLLFVYIVFFFHYFKYYGQNVFSRTSVL